MSYPPPPNGYDHWNYPSSPNTQGQGPEAPAPMHHMTPPGAPPEPEPENSNRAVGVKAMSFTVAIGMALMLGGGVSLYATDVISADALSSEVTLEDGALAHQYGPETELCEQVDYSAVEDVFAPVIGSPLHQPRLEYPPSASQACTVKFFDEESQVSATTIIDAKFWDDESNAASSYAELRELDGEVSKFEGDWDEGKKGYYPDASQLETSVVDGNGMFSTSIFSYHALDVAEDDLIAASEAILEEIMSLSRGNSPGEEPAPPEVSSEDEGRYELFDQPCDDLDFGDLEKYDFDPEDGAGENSVREDLDHESQTYVKCHRGKESDDPNVFFTFFGVDILADRSISYAQDQYEIDRMNLIMDSEDGYEEISGDWEQGLLGHETDSHASGEDIISTHIALQDENLRITIQFKYQGDKSNAESDGALIAIAEQLVAAHRK